MSEGRRKMTEDRCQRAEVRGQMSEGREHGAEGIEGGLRPLRAVGSIYEPEAVGDIGAYPPACKPMAYKPTGWPPARSGTILRLGEKRPRREVGMRNAEI